MNQQEAQVFHSVALLLAQEGQLWPALQAALDGHACGRVVRGVLERRRELSRTRRDRLDEEIADLERVMQTMNDEE